MWLNCVARNLADIWFIGKGAYLERSSFCGSRHVRSLLVEHWKVDEDEVGGEDPRGSLRGYGPPGQSHDLQLEVGVTAKRDSMESKPPSLLEASNMTSPSAYLHECGLNMRVSNIKDRRDRPRTLNWVTQGKFQGGLKISLQETGSEVRPSEDSLESLNSW